MATQTVEQPRVIPIAISKAKATIPVNPADFDDTTYWAIWAEGAKAFLNKNMSKIKTRDLEGDELELAQEEALEKAKENLERLKAGQLKARKAAGSKIPREVLTRALQLARDAIKGAYRAAGKKTTGIKASVWTELGKKTLDGPRGEAFIAKARKEIAARDAIEAVGIEVDADLAAMIATAEDAKPRVAPPKKAKATTEQVVAGKAKVQAATKGASVRH